MGRGVLPDLSALASGLIDKNSALGPSDPRAPFLSTRPEACADKSGNTHRPMR